MGDFFLFHCCHTTFPCLAFLLILQWFYTLVSSYLCSIPPYVIVFWFHKLGFVEEMAVMGTFVSHFYITTWLWAPQTQQRDTCPYIEPSFPAGVFLIVSIRISIMKRIHCAVQNKWGYFQYLYNRVFPKVIWPRALHCSFVLLFEWLQNSWSFPSRSGVTFFTWDPLTFLHVLKCWVPFVIDAVITSFLFNF